MDLSIHFIIIIIIIIIIKKVGLQSTTSHCLKGRRNFFSIIQKTLLKPIADSLIQKGSRLTHIYGLSKTHKKKRAFHTSLPSGSMIS